MKAVKEMAYVAIVLPITGKDENFLHVTLHQRSRLHMTEVLKDS